MQRLHFNVNLSTLFFHLNPTIIQRRWIRVDEWHIFNVILRQCLLNVCISFLWYRVLFILLYTIQDSQRIYTHTHANTNWNWLTLLERIWGWQLPNTAVVDINSCEHSDESSPYQRLTKALQCDPRCGHEVSEKFPSTTHTHTHRIYIYMHLFVYCQLHWYRKDTCAV